MILILHLQLAFGMFVTIDDCSLKSLRRRMASTLSSLTTGIRSNDETSLPPRYSPSPPSSLFSFTCYPFINFCVGE